jgi:hypothetical protein
MARDFSELNKYAKREYKFVQGDSFGLIEKAILAGILSDARRNGVCMGATLKWINEKLSTSNSYFKSDGRLRGSTQREFSNSINPLSRMGAGLSISQQTALGKVVNSNSLLKKTFKGKSHARNEGTMLRAADVQTAYAKTPSVDDARVAMNSNFRKVNTYSPKVIEQDVPPIAKRFGYNDDMPKRDEPETISQAAFGLPQGLAILIELRDLADVTGHAIAFYRSRLADIGSGGRTLYFFDSNAGVYKISTSTKANIKAFIEAWLRVYANHTVPLVLETAPLDWCTAFTRA